jgi:hypothetical protein
MKKLSIFIAVLIIALGAQSLFAQEGKELVIKTKQALETAPTAKETEKMATASMKWIIETDQVTVGMCTGVFTLFADKKNKHSGDMTSAYTIGMGAFKLENPAKASDEMAAQLAGLELALKVYEAFVKEKPKTKHDGIEALLVKRNNGELAALVKGIDCGKRL